MDNAVNIEVDNSQVAAQTPVNNVATNIEVDDSQLSTQTVDNSVDNSQVINNATPMDNNITYNNLSEEERTPAIGNHVSPLQGAIEDAMTIQRNRLMTQNAGAAMDNFLNNEYDYDKSEAGTYWVAGAINDNATQMKFLDAIVKEQMYDNLDLQKYYYDNTMATARAYAASKNKEAAYGFYRAAQEKAIAEASYTGWYMPAEGEYMLGQYTVAQTTLARDNATPAEINKAKDVIKTTEKWFNANQIGTRGIKCLSLLNFEERVRHNKEAERLQDQANQIAGASADISEAMANLQLREFKFRVEEMELQSGRNFSKEIGLDDKDYFGHDINDPDYAKYSMLFGGQTLEEITKDPRIFDSIKTSRGIQWLKSNLGDKYETIFQNYTASKNASSLLEGELNIEGGTGLTLTLKNKTFKLSSGEDIQTTGKVSFVPLLTDGQITWRAFIEDTDGNKYQLNSSEAFDASYKNGEDLSKFINEKDFISAYTYDDGIKTYDKLYDKNGNSVSLGISTRIKNELTGDLYNGALRSQKVVDTVQNKAKEGFEVMYGYYADDKGTTGDQKIGVIMYNRKTDEWIGISISGAPYHAVSGGGEGEVFNLSKDKVYSIKDTNFDKIKDSQSSSAQRAAISQMVYVDQKLTFNKKGEAEEGGTVLCAYQTTNGTIHWVEMKADAGDTMSFDPFDGKEITEKEAISKYGEKNINTFKNNRENYNDRREASTSTYEFSGRKADVTALDLGNIDTVDAEKIISEGSEISNKTRQDLYQKYEISESEAPKFDSLHGEDLLEALKNKSMNNVIESQNGG